MKYRIWLGGGILVAALSGSALTTERAALAFGQAPTAAAPEYEVEPFWPKSEGNWVLSSIGGIAVDPTNDHVFVLNRPNTIDTTYGNYAARVPPIAECCVPIGHVVEFDPDGHLVRSWGGPAWNIPGAKPMYDWPENAHGIHIDYKGNVWIGGNGENDAQILKFTKDGKFLLQIGKKGKSSGSNDTANFAKAAKAFVYQKTNEVFIADGYINRRVIIFDADTGQYKRHWGAFGNKPDDTASRARVFTGLGPPQFNIVHAVSVSNDNLVYVADRVNNRIQVFTPEGKFIKQAFISRQTDTDTGTACDLTLSLDSEQRHIYLTDPVNQKIVILRRDTLEQVTQFGRFGRYPGQWYNLHVIAPDSKGNLYTGENHGHRVQKFHLKKTSSR